MILVAWLCAGVALASNPAPSDASGLPAGHPAVSPGAQPPSAEQLLQQLDSTPGLREKSKPFEVAAALGKLYFTHARYPDAILYLRQSVDGAEPLRTLLLAERKRARGPLPTADAAGCRLSSEAQVQVLADRARKHASEGHPALAAACGLEAFGPALEAGALLGNALYLTGDASRALAAYASVLEVDPAEPDALYGHAGVLFDTKGDDLRALRQARKEFAAFLTAHPGLPQVAQARALLARTDALLAAGGASKYAQRTAREERLAGPVSSEAPTPAPAGSAGPLSPEAVEAVRNTERTPELLQGLAKLLDEGEEHLAHGRYQEALDAYKRVVPFEPESGRAKAGMAWALVGLKREPMADRVWGVAVEADPAAVDALGDVLSRKGNAAEARALWTRLASSAPGYAEKTQLTRKAR